MLAHWRAWLQRWRTTNTGAGAVAQGPAALATGARGVSLQGSASHNTVVTGDHVTVHTGPTARDTSVLLTAYGQMLVAQCQYLPLRGVDIQHSDPQASQRRLELAQVYIALQTTAQKPPADARERQTERLREEERAPLSALEAVSAHAQVVLLGDPGSGKSTFLHHLALRLATPLAQGRGDTSPGLPGWPVPQAPWVPVMVVLRDLARWLVHTGVQQPTSRHLWDFLVTRLAAEKLEGVADILEQTLEQGQAVLLLDGLDEIPTAEERLLVREAVQAGMRRYSLSRVIVTCRTLAYQDAAGPLAELPDFTLAPFTAQHINAFIAAWYEELQRLQILTAAAASGLAERLQQAVRRPDLWRLAPNPLLLTMMALVHTHRNRLPEARALLYEETITFLLWHWEELKVGRDGPTPRLRALLEQAECTDADLRGVLCRLALAAHGASGAGEAVADISALSLRTALAALHPQESLLWARQVLEAMTLRAGLLLERAPEVYAFPHRTFQEYLAGAALSARGDFAQEAARLSATGPLWREPVLLAVGRLVHLSLETDRPLALVGELCPAQALETAVGWRQAALAGEVLLEMGRNGARGVLGQDLLQRVQQRLLALLRTSPLSPVQRAAAGNTLAGLGDPRFRAEAWFLPDEPLLGWVEIPAGPFRMGSDPGQDAMAYADEQPQHEVVLPRYYLARYPVTVAQWRAFVQASGHTPRNADSLQGPANHPVVWVSWHEALAYGDWLTAQLQGWPGTPEPLAGLLRHEGWRVTLPSEAEWEKAARGTDGRRYPWGAEPDPQRENYDATGIDTTSAVGCFPTGASPYGLEEMSGNVWEWTRSLWRESSAKPIFPYPYNPDDGREQLQAADDMPRVLRGGAFWSGHQYARCACRYYGDARDVLSLVGFRVVVRPCSGL